MHQNKNHRPVLLETVLQYLAPQPGESYLDVTAGYGGHAAAVLKRTLDYKSSVLVDRDEQAATYLRQQFGAKGSRILDTDYATAAESLLSEGRQFDMVLADLGVSSPHLDRSSRGFSFLHEGPLDMRMDRRQNLTAETIVNSFSEKELVSIFRRYGQEPKSQRVARQIISHRPLTTTTALAKVVAKAAGWRAGTSRVHPATRVFQALRIAINDELRILEKALPLWVELLKTGGRVVVISFHSLEDRLVKQKLREYSQAGYQTQLKLLTKKPFTAEAREIVLNPRARSAKLRAAVKIKTEAR